jgi:hypothetical protein
LLLQSKKQEMIDKVLTEGEVGSMRLGVDELIALFGKEVSEEGLE